MGEHAAEDTRPVVPPRVRDYAYPILLALAPLGVIYGLVTEAEAAAWVGLGGAMLGLGAATAYRPSRTLGGTDERGST